MNSMGSCLQTRIGLIIVDGVMSLFRREYGEKEIKQRQEKIAEFLNV